MLRYGKVISFILFSVYGFVNTTQVYADEESSQRADTVRVEQVRNPWTIKAGLGIHLTGGNSDNRTFTIDGDASRRFRMFHYRGILRRALGTSSYSGGPRIETTNNWLINSRFDWFTSARRNKFLFTFISVDGNKYRGYTSKRTAQLGYGVKFFTTYKPIDVNIALGIDYSKEVLVVRGTRRNEIFSGVLKPELDLTLNDGLAIGQRTSIFVDLQDEEEYQIDMTSFINLKLSGKFSLRTTYTLNYRNKPRLINELDQSGRPTGNRILAKPSDHTFTTSILLNF